MLSSESKHPSSARSPLGLDGMTILLTTAPLLLFMIQSAFTSPTYRYGPTTSSPSGPELSLLTPETQPSAAAPAAVLQPAKPGFTNCVTLLALGSYTSIDLLVRSVT